MVVFISMRMEDSAGRGWLRAPDGWLLERELHNSSGTIGSPAAVFPFPDITNGVVARSPSKSANSDGGVSGSAVYSSASRQQLQHIRQQQMEDINAMYSARKPFVPFSLPLEARRAYEEQIELERAEQRHADFNSKQPATGVRSDSAALPMLDGDSIEDEIDERLAELRDLLGMEARTTARYTALREAINSSAICRSRSPPDAAIKSRPSSLRLRHMANVQHHLHTVAKNLAQLSESVLLCQQSLADLVRGTALMHCAVSILF